MGEANQRGDFNTRRQEAIAKDRELHELRKRAAYLAAIVRREGRVRITKADMEACGEAYEMTLHRDGDTITLSWGK